MRRSIDGWCRLGVWVAPCLIASLLQLDAAAAQQSEQQAVGDPAPSATSAVDAGVGAEQADAGPSPAELERARSLFGEGLAFVEQQDWVQAEHRFREVLAIRSSHVVSYNLASALVHLGRLNESAELLRVILRDGQADVETRAAAEQLLMEIEPQIGSITIRVLGDIRGAWLRLDENPVELSTRVMTLSVDPGRHSLSVERAGELMAVRELEVGGDHPLRAEALFELPPVSGAVSQQMIKPRPGPTRATPVQESTMTTGKVVRQPHAGEDSLLSQWWFWGGVTLIAASATVTLIAVSGSSEADPVTGDTDPPLVRARVLGGMP